VSVQEPLVEPRDYQQLLDDSVARISVHNPEWTNHNRSDPGITLLELFAFMADNVGYVANQVPERNRRRFLELLGAPRSPGAAARGLLVIANEHGPATRTAVASGLEALGKDIAFRTEQGLDVLPVQARAYVKRPLEDAPKEILDLHRQLYASEENATDAEDVRLYETVPLERIEGGAGMQATADGALWLALLLRDQDPPEALDEVRRQLAGARASIGLVPALDDPEPPLDPLGQRPEGSDRRVELAVPIVDAAGAGAPRYRTLDVNASGDVLSEPGVVQVTLPSAIDTWRDLDPLVAGVGALPPSLEDTDLELKVVTWVRIRPAPGAAARFLWAGLNTVTITQRSRVTLEVLPPGTGEPDQQVSLGRRPVVADSVRVEVRAAGRTTIWRPIDDLLAAGPEVPAPDPASPPGAAAPAPRPSEVFAVDAAAGVLTYGDGARGARPARLAEMRASYDTLSGAAANLGPGAVKDAPALPSGLTVRNPVRTWGGGDPEGVDEAQKQIRRLLQHRDRLVTVDDFETITWRTPGVQVGRVDVLRAFSPELAPSTPGDAPGAVTVVVAPRDDPEHPGAPRPDRLFLGAVCRHLDRRRLVTTEVHVRGPDYVPIWISVGIVPEAGVPFVDAREAVMDALTRFLAPIDPEAPPWWDEAPLSVDEPFVHVRRGWPLGRSVLRLELVAVANRVAGVRMVSDLKLARGGDAATDEVPLSSLELPQVLGIACGEGIAPDLGLQVAPPPAGPKVVPVPKVPDSC
jgi:hypothetical protein